MTPSSSTAPAAHPGERAGHFRPDVEGLRAVAVLAVLFYHAGTPGFPGGYVGVDVFFVISGFLITGLILREIDATGRLSLGGFYARRARRLLPAACLTLVATLIASMLWLPSVRVPDVATDIASAAAYVSNLRFGAAANDYFAADLAPSPVLHFWSLSVEEQFYLFWPALLLLLGAIAARLRSGRSGLLVGVALVSATSFILGVWLTSINQPWAFFLLPTRAWELGLGALIAIAAPRLPGLRPSVAVALVGVGLGLVALSCLLLDDTSTFPGLLAVPPVVGAALVIVGGHGRNALSGRLLGSRPGIFLGGISYSLYLWHWPMLVFAAVLAGDALSVPVALAVALAAIPVAALSQRLVEQPFRVGRLIGLRPRLNLGQAVASTLVVVIACAGAGTMARSSIEGQLGDLIPNPGELERTVTGWCGLPPEVDDPAACVLGDPGATTTWVLFGDSTAEQWVPALASIATERGIRLVSLARGGCPFAQVAFIQTRLNRVETECDEWREHVLARIDAEDPALVVLVNLSHPRLVVDGQETGDRPTVLAAYRAGVDATLDRLPGRRVAIIGTSPISPVDVPECIVANPDDHDACRLPPTARRSGANAVLRDAAAAHGAAFADPSDWLCDDTGCPAVMPPYLVYRDRVHLTEPFSASLAPRVAEFLDAFPVPVPATPSPSPSVEPSPSPSAGV